MRFLMRRSVLATALLSLSAPLLWAQVPPPPNPPVFGHRRVILAIGPGPQPFLLLLRSAHLTPAQMRRVRQIMVAQAAQSAPLIRQLRHDRGQISDKLLGSGPVTAADLAPLQEQVMQIQGKMSRNMIHTALEIRKVLTRDQLKRLSEVHQKLESLRLQIEKLIGPGSLGPAGPMPPG